MGWNNDFNDVMNEEPKEYNKTVYEGYKAGHFRKDGSISSISRITNKDVEGFLRNQPLTFIPEKFVRLNEKPYKLQHACVVGGAKTFTSDYIGVVYFYNTPIYFVGCPLCRTVYYYCVKVQDLEIENMFKAMGIYPNKIVQLDSTEFSVGNNIQRIRHCCKETGVTRYNLLVAKNRGIDVHYALCPKCGKLYYYKEENYIYE